MKQTKILVVCGQNRHRSPTAQQIYRDDSRVKIVSAGLSTKSPHRISSNDIKWADIILYMESNHLEKIKKLFPNTKLPKAYNLNIKDKYEYMNPQLVEILTEKIETILDHN